MAERRRHPQHRDLYTPITPEVIALWERMRAEHGTWRKVCALGEVRMKVMRTLRGKTGRDQRKAVSQRLMDRLCTGTGVGHIHEFEWFTADDLVTLGIWEEPHVLDTDEGREIMSERRRERRARQASVARRRRKARRSSRQDAA